MRRHKKLIIIVGAVCAVTFMLGFLTTCYLIGNDVKLRCYEAKIKYNGTCVNALALLLADESNTFKSRNSAIWALGQLGDSRALPILQKYYTGNIPQREPVDGVISQHELKKAINLAQGSINLTAIFWRHNIE